MLSGLIGRYARCPRHTRSGFPDLTLWNVKTGAFKVISMFLQIKIYISCFRFCGSISMSEKQFFVVVNL